MPVSDLNDWINENPITIGNIEAAIIADTDTRQTPIEVYDYLVDVENGKKRRCYSEIEEHSPAYEIHRLLLQEKINRPIHQHTQDQVHYNEKYEWAHLIPSAWLFDEHNIPVLMKVSCSGISTTWLVELHHAIAITDAPYAYLSILNPDTLQHIHFSLSRDNYLIKNLMVMEAEFYSSLIRRARDEIGYDKIITTGRVVNA